MEVPGLEDLSPGVNEVLTAISCTGPGDCTAGGADNSNDPTHAFGLNQAWVASEASTLTVWPRPAPVYVTLIWAPVAIKARVVSLR